eukprot:SAG31_NODE_6647_length_1939_cov_14.997826_1_plen_133_part_10
MIENVIAAAPIWLRNSLLSAAVGATLVRLSGFYNPTRRGQMSHLRHGVGASGVQTSGIRLSVGNERLETLINDNADFREALTDYADRHALQDEIIGAFGSKPANLAVAEPESVNPTGLCSLIVTLLSGHGLKP